MWRGVGEQKQSGNESQWRRIHFSVPASVGPSPLLSRLSLTRMMAHVYTHEPHARTYFWSENSKGTLWSLDYPRESFLGGIFFSLLPPFPSFLLFSPFSACFELSRSENLRFLERTVSTPLEDPWEPFAAETMKRHCVSDKGFKQLYDRVLTRPGLFTNLESSNLSAPGYVNRENEIRRTVVWNSFNDSEGR